MKALYFSALFFTLLLASSCSTTPASSTEKAASGDSLSATNDTIKLPKPFETKSTTNFSKVIGWVNGKMPIAPQGFTVTKYADSLKSIRWIYVLPNGDVLVSQANTEPSAVKKVGMKIIGADKTGNNSGSPDCITLLRDANKDGIPETRQLFLSGLNKPLGMTLIGNSFYVAVTDGVWQYPYNEGELSIKATGKKIMELPAGGYNNHWTRNLLASKDGSKIYISVGSASNVGEYGFEEEIRRANILEINPDGTGERIYGSGLRNPVGMAWAPGTSTLWTAVNERDLLGDELVPDYITSVKDGGFYGWPYSYIGKNLDPRIDEKDQRPDLVEKAIIPDVLLGSHTASLGLTFYEKNSFPEKYHGGAFIGQHGSWNRKELAGYKVLFIPFRNGKPAGLPEDFLTGFVADADNSKVYGRPAGVAVAPDGSLLVADDASNVVWRVAVKK
jgi:glucose/arabinose dehydrogenase